MSEEKLNQLIGLLTEVKEEIQAMPECTANGQLIDAAMHANCSAEHLKRYYAMQGRKQ